MTRLSCSGIGVDGTPFTVDLSWIRRPDGGGFDEAIGDVRRYAAAFAGDVADAAELAERLAPALLASLDAQRVEVCVRQERDGIQLNATAEAPADSAAQAAPNTGGEGSAWADAAQRNVGPDDAGQGNLERRDSEQRNRYQGNLEPESPRSAYPESHAAVLGLECPESADAEGLLQAVIVAVDAIAGVQVEGISPLYQVSSLDGADSLTAVLSLSTSLDAAGLRERIGELVFVRDHVLTVTLLAFDGAGCASEARRAAFLAPWLDMDAQGELDGTPLSFHLATAPDALQAGLKSDRWVFGGML